MKTALYILGMLVLFFGIYWLRVWPFREKKTKEPEQTAPAKVLSRRVQSGTHRSGRSSGMGYTYLVTFEQPDGTQLELYAYDTEYGALREGMEGTLTWKGPYFVNFTQEVTP